MSRSRFASFSINAGLLVVLGFVISSGVFAAAACSESDKTVELARELIARPSITPHDAGCTDIIVKRLQALGFQTEILKFGQVTNLWATLGSKGPLFVFAGHTDVVPIGNLQHWVHSPFEATLKDDYLYGRGATDMKGPLAAMVVAVEEFVRAQPRFYGRLGFLLTSNEEGMGAQGNKEDGTKKLMAYLYGEKGVRIDYCVVGEPTSEEALGDVIKHGRRGSLSGELTIYGKQGHVAYPERAHNPIHHSLAVLSDLVATQWDTGNADFQPTSLQISNIRSGTGAGNVIPGELTAQFNFRYAPSVDQRQLKERVEAILDQHASKYELNWNHTAEPFLTKNGRLVPSVLAAIADVTGRVAKATTGGGTSDARFIAPYGVEVLEFGPRNDTIHAINERVAVQELKDLTQIYKRILERLLLSRAG